MRCWLRDARSARLGSLAVGLALVALTLVGPGAALAAEPAKPAEAVAQTAEKWPMLWDLSLLLGYDVLSSQTGLGNAYDSRDVPTSSLMTGVRLTAWVFDELGFEVEGKYVPTQFEHDTSGKANLFGVRAQGVYRFMTQSSVQPFVSLGGGWDMLSADATALRSKGIYVAPSDWDYTIMAGAGVRWQVMDHLALRVDLRYVLGEARKGTAVGSNFEPMLALAYGIGGKPGDADGDGILDNVDKCPDQAEDKDGFEDQDGCPDIDNDGDGIIDYPRHDDKCPDKPETFNGIDDDDGCPDEMPVEVVKPKEFKNIVVEADRIVFKKQILFATNSAKIVGALSEEILDEAAEALKDRPDVRVQVEGHTDERGPDKKNKKLSQARAESVVAALVSRSIARSRLVPMGFGEEKPIDKGHNAEAWDKNRRVEFNFLQ